jgi:hypothetical protein
MYFTRTSPIIRDKKADTISTTVALKTECACEGCSSPNPRAHRERGRGLGSVEVEPVTAVDSTVAFERVLLMESG